MKDDKKIQELPERLVVTKRICVLLGGGLVGWPAPPALAPPVLIVIVPGRAADDWFELEEVKVMIGLCPVPA